MFILFIMTLIASLIATTRINIEYRFRISFISLFIATFLPLIILIYIGIIKISPFHVIPVGGLILGNALNSITIAVDRFLGETRNRILVRNEGKFEDRPYTQDKYVAICGNSAYSGDNGRYAYGWSGSFYFRGLSVNNPLSYTLHRYIFRIFNAEFKLQIHPCQSYHVIIIIP